MWWGDDDPPTGCADLLDVNGHVVPAPAGGRLSTHPPSACSGIGRARVHTLCRWVKTLAEHCCQSGDAHRGGEVHRLQRDEATE